MAWAEVAVFLTLERYREMLSGFDIDSITHSVVYAYNGEFAVAR